MAERIRDHDWGATALGPIDAWPQSLRTVVELMLNARQPAYVAWGPDLVSLYNDSLIPVVGSKHPAGLGQPFAELWAEIWDEYRPVVAATMAGEAQYFVDRPVALSGRPDRPVSWFTFSWTPLRDETGAVAGFYCAATETTEKVRAETALRKSSDAALRQSEARYRTLFETMDEGFCILQLIFDQDGTPVDYRFLETNPAFERQTGLKAALGRTIRELVPDLEASWFEIYGKVALTGEPTRFVNQAEPMRRWFDVHAFRVGEPAQHQVAVLFNDITARKQAEEALRRSEARLRGAFAISTVGALFWDEDFRLIDANDAFLRMSGYSRDEVLGRRWQELTPDEFHAPSNKAVDEIVTRGECTPYEKQYFRKDGSRWWGLFAARKVGSEAVEFVLDVTDHREAETRLRESEARLSQVQEAARIGSFEFDRRTGRAATSREYLDLYGLPEDRSGTFDYHDWLGLVHPEDRPWVEAETRAAVANPACAQLDYDFRIKRADNGETRWIAARTRLLRDADGRFVRSLGAQWDVTDDNKAAAALRESEARFRHMADSAPALIWMTDEDGKFNFVNMHFEHIFGRPAFDMMGDGWHEVVHPDDLPDFERDFLACFAARKPFRREVRVYDRHGAVRWLRCEGVPRLDDTGHFLGFTGCNVDITEAKVAEERRDLLINELNHRVKNTLATVQSIASQTLRNTETAAEAKEAIEGRLLALSRAHDVLTRENWEGADLYAIVRQAVEPYSSRGEDRLHLSGPKVRLSPRTALSFAMLLQELATNAVKYGALSNETGEVRIAWETEPDTPEPRLHLRWEENGGPPVSTPSRRGFGTRLIERSLAHDLDGDVHIAFAPAGLVCTVAAPLGHKADQ
ncbi:PAS domain S-box protein [Microvirga subterranea]|uniref:Blue-light-activated histidine kinase n=1 Tax=Microvirga subterranea TaxID=186651 RepID=A0A370HSX7_9HYPH|nr:PAS domain S-box protein [Microvirga subterranea]RDI60064.1 PAS domain S-box-containing protein [Microvirga subterranea]